MEQHDEICIWIEVETTNKKEIRIFETFGTGHEIEQIPGINRKYINSVKYYDGNLIFHIYERI